LGWHFIVGPGSSPERLVERIVAKKRGNCYTTGMGNDKNEAARKKLGEKLRKAREKANLTQAEVAEKAEITVTYYAITDCGDVNPSFDTP